VKCHANVFLLRNQNDFAESGFFNRPPSHYIKFRWHVLCGQFPVCRRTGRANDWLESPFRWQFFGRMKKNLQLTRIVLYQNLGFLGIMAICYFNDLLKLPSLIFSDHPFAFVYRRSTLEILLVLAVWLLVSASTRRILERLRYLEKFMRVCAWCRKINYHGQWMPLEDFMRHGFDTPTTHGICTGCLRKQEAAAEKAKLARKNKTAENPVAPEKNLAAGQPD
jgi:hypothetical protein